MSASENKQLLKKIYDAMAEGNTAPFLENLTEDIVWTLSGKTKWSQTYSGLEEVRTKLFAPLFANFADQYTGKATRFIAEDDYVVVEYTGRTTTKSGKPYNNSYCNVFRLADGKIREITEYCDTELVSEVIDGKNAADAQQSAAMILKLYELRREEKMRESRIWYFTEFAPQSAMDIINLYRAGERASANYRTITSYWDMAAALVLNGAIGEKMFADANTEHLFIYAKIAPFLAEIRQLFGEPDYLTNLEKLALQTPAINEKIEARKRLNKIWTQKRGESSAGN